MEEGIVEVLDVEQGRSGAEMVLDVEEALLWRCRSPMMKWERRGACVRMKKEEG